MAGTKLSFKSRIQASTLLEVLISMIFIVVIFGIAMMIYTNVVRQSLSVQQMHAQAVLQRVLNDAETGADLSDKTLSVDSVQVAQIIRADESDSSLVTVLLTAYDKNNKALAELRKVIIKR